MLGHTARSFVSLLALAASVTSVHAAVSISSTCQNTVKGLLASKDAECLNPGAILSFIVGAETSIKDTIDTWVSGLCNTGACTNETLESVVKNITVGCQEEMNTVGASSGIQGQFVDIVQRTYPTVRKIVCLKNDLTNKLCVSETLASVESTIGSLELKDLSFLSIMEDARKLVATGVKTLVCTDCLKAAYTVARTDFPDIVGAINGESKDLCGASFIDGETPDTVSETAVQGVFTSKNNSALSRQSAPVLGLTLLMTSIMYIFLA